MVSIKRNIGLLFINFIIFLCFMGLYTISNAAICTSSQAPCCKGKTLSCCPHPGYDSKGNELSYDLSACTQIDGPVIDGGEIIGPIDPIVKCTSGQSQYKPNGDCGTSERTCCSDGTWSGWDGECSDSSSCGLNECWDGSKCAAKPSSTACTCTNGTCSLTYSCISGSGWKSTKNCTCSSGYQKNSSGECVHSSCAKNCGTGMYLREIASGLNKGQCECCAPLGHQKLADGSCGGLNTRVTCMADYKDYISNNVCCEETRATGIVIVYGLPSKYSSCSDLGRAVGWTMKETSCCRDRIEF